MRTQKREENISALQGAPRPLRHFKRAVLVCLVKAVETFTTAPSCSVKFRLNPSLPLSLSLNGQASLVRKKEAIQKKEYPGSNVIIQMFPAHVNCFSKDERTWRVKLAWMPTNSNNVAD